jgi:hypothetical protein
MDPNETLKAIRDGIVNLRDLMDQGYAPYPEDVQRLLSQAEALDEWLSKGGFLPKEWASLRFVTYGREEYKVIETEFEDSYDDTQRYSVWVERNPEYDD